MRQGADTGSCFMLKWDLKDEPLPGIYRDWHEAEHARLNFVQPPGANLGCLRIVVARWYLVPPQPWNPRDLFNAVHGQRQG